MNIIEEARLEKCISQAELARRTGFSRSYISKLESDKKLPSNDAIKKISDALSMCPVTLYIFFYLNNEYECRWLEDKNVFFCDCTSCKKESKD